MNPFAAPELVHEAQVYGLSPSPGARANELTERLADRKVYTSWVYSVCRHLLQAKWIYHRDSGLDFAVLWVASQLEADEKLSSRCMSRMRGTTTI